MEGGTQMEKTPSQGHTGIIFLFLVVGFSVVRRVVGVFHFAGFCLTTGFFLVAMHGDLLMCLHEILCELVRVIGPESDRTSSGSDSDLRDISYILCWLQISSCPLCCASLQSPHASP